MYIMSNVLSIHMLQYDVLFHLQFLVMVEVTVWTCDWALCLTLSGDKEETCLLELLLIFYSICCYFIILFESHFLHFLYIMLSIYVELLLMFVGFQDCAFFRTSTILNLFLCSCDVAEFRPKLYQVQW